MESELCVDVYIEISKNSHIKYEFNHKKNILVCDRILHTPFSYPFNYGFIPNTLSLDNDPIDVIVLMDDELIPGCSIKCKFLGCLETRDDEGVDPKLIMCPCDKIDPTYKSIHDIHDIPAHTIEKIRYFYKHYKDLEHKQVEIGNILDKNAAIRIYKKSCENYRVTHSL